MPTLTQLIEHYCSDGVEFVRLGDVVTIRNGSDWKTQEPGDVAVYGSGGKMEPTVKVPASVEPSVLLPRKGSLDVQFVSDPFWNIDTAFRTETDPSRLSMKYFYYLMKGVNLAEISTSATRPSLTQTALKELILPLPPREVQDAIVERLDAFAALIESLDSEIALREKRFEHFREQLLAFDESDGVEYVKLGDVAESVKSGATPKARTAEYYDNGTIPWLRTNEVKFNTITSTEMKVTEKALVETPIKWIEAPSVVVAISGATAGRSAIIATPVTTNQHCCCLHFDEAKANYRFVFNSLALRYEELKSLGRGARGDLNAGIIKNFQIPLPSLEAQQDIADKLDTMQALIDNLKQESELRRTQFEYYREKLLTFNS